MVNDEIALNASVFIDYRAVDILMETWPPYSLAWDVSENHSAIPVQSSLSHVFALSCWIQWK